MKCEIIRNGIKLAGPMDYNMDSIKNIIGRHGGNVNLVPFNLSSAVSIGGIVIKRVRDIRPNLTRMTRHVFDRREETAGEVIYHYTVANKSPSSVRAELKNQLSQLQDNYASSPMNYNGVMINTGLETRINMQAALNRFIGGEMTSVQWRGKAASEGNVLDVASTSERARVDIASTTEMQALYDATFVHIAKGIQAQSSLEEAIDALTDVELSAYDLRGAFNAAVA